MNVVIDSSILRTISYFNSPEFSLLVELTELDIIKIYIPEIVMKECRSQQIEELKKKYNTLLSTISKFGKECANEVAKSKELFESIKEKSEKEIKKRFKNFIEKAKVNILAIDDKHGKKIMDAYFKGKPPFSSVKCRNDIPDAFIYNAILDLKKESNEIIFLCNDNNLNKSIEELGIKVFTSISDFLIFNNIKLGIDDISIKKENVKSLIDKIIKNSEKIKFIKENIEKHKDKVIELLEVWAKTEFNEIDVDSIQHDYNGDPDITYISDFEEFDNIGINFNNLGIYSRGICTVSFKLSFEVGLEMMLYAHGEYHEGGVDATIGVEGEANIYLNLSNFDNDKESIFKDMKVDAWNYRMSILSPKYGPWDYQE